MSVFEQRRLFREAELCCYGAEHAISIDIFKREGQWMCSVVDTATVRLIAECVIGTNSIVQAGNMLRALGRRSNTRNVKVVVIDDVHYQAADPQEHAFVPVALVLAHT